MTEPVAKTCCGPSRAETKPVQPIPVEPSGEAKGENLVHIPGGQGYCGTNHPIIPVDGEAPLKTARIKPFVMEATTVTTARFAAFVSDTGYQTDAERLGNSFVFAPFLAENAGGWQRVAEAPWWAMVDGANWRAPFGAGSEGQSPEDHPVVHVTWNDAQAFAKWAGGRLPTEKEWEHAARGGLGDVPFPWGDQEPNDQDFFPCNIWQGRFPDHDMGLDGHIGTAPARSFAPNGYGLYNMVGNVWEYTSQPFKVKSLKKGVRRAHAGKAGFKLSKGGSFLCHASYCFRYRIAARTGTSADSSTSHQGFRLVFDG